MKFCFVLFFNLIVWAVYKDAVSSVDCQLDTHLGDGPPGVHGQGWIFFNSFIEVWSPVHCGWQCCLAGICDRIHGEGEMSSILHSLLFGFRSLQLLPLWPSCHDGLQPRIVGQNSPFLCFCCNIFIHQQEKKPRRRGTLIFKTRKLGGHYPKGQLNTWLPEFKAILMCRSLSVSHAVNRGSHESHGCLWSWFSST